MNPGEFSVKNRLLAWLLVIVLVAGGIQGFPSMGKLEDPNFTIKEAKIVTFYPGADARQVQDEVTYHIEEAIQLMPQLSGRGAGWPGPLDRTGSLRIQIDQMAADNLPDKQLPGQRHLRREEQ